MSQRVDNAYKAVTRLFENMGHEVQPVPIGKQTDEQFLAAIQNELFAILNKIITMDEADSGWDSISLYTMLFALFLLAYAQEISDKDVVKM